MPFDDLEDEDADDDTGADPGDAAMDELAGTLSGESAELHDSAEDTSQEDAETAADAEYDPATDPAFPTVKDRTQHSVYCLPATWDAIDGASGLLFEAEVRLRRDDYGAVQKRELHNAFLQAAADQLSAEDVADALIATRQERRDGPLLEES